MKPGKVLFIVLDGVGVGELPDADAYGDRGTNTVGNTARVAGNLRLPNLGRLGLGNLTEIQGVPQADVAEGCYGKMEERSAGKDSTTGHWELSGIIIERSFPLYPGGFPHEVLDRFVSVTGSKGYLGNKPASGTEIIEELGDEHIKTGYPIVYTSGDSVFQIAAHERVIPLEELYAVCRKTRDEVMIGEHAVGRIIARPFVGTSGSYSRTPDRKDFALEPPGITMLDLLMEAGVETVGVGKIDDLFSGRGLKEKIHTKSNADGIHVTLDIAKRMKNGLLMTNLVDFDMLYGHRQDPQGFAKSLEEFDSAVPDTMACLNDGDLLIITADHGNDPTDKSTDHSREYVPLLCYSPSGKRNIKLGIRSTFADAGKTLADFFGLGSTKKIDGTSFLQQVV